MAELKGLDIAWDRPTIAAIRATGARWVGRYLSPDPTKNLTAAEVISYPAAGLGIVTVWESTAARALAGVSAGQSDAKSAEAQRKLLGLPGDHVVYFAVDTDASWSQVWPYFQGVLSVLPLARVGVYGGLRVVSGAHGQGLRYLWQTVAWSAGQWSPFASIRQTGAELLGGAADVDFAEVADFGQFPRPVAPKPAPVTPTPAPPPLPFPPKESRMVLVSVDQSTVPSGTAWPGVFLLTQELELRHVATPEDTKAFKAAGVTGPFTISYAQYQGLLAGT